MEYRDAGKSYGGGGLVTASAKDKYYPTLEIDLFKFPELSEDIGEECTLIIKGIVTRKTLSDQDKCQSIEIRSIGVGEPKAEDKPSGNEADMALEHLKSPKRY